MNRNDFLRMIESTGPADRATINEVNELVNIFPYFQSAYMLLLKGLSNTSDVRFENQLKISAINIADREVLYYFLKKEPGKEVKRKLIAESAPVPEDNIADSQQTVIESAKNSDDLINEIEKASVGDAEDGKDIENVVLISDETGYDESNATIILVDEKSGEIDEKITYMDPGFSVPEKNDLLELDLSETNQGTAAPDEVHSEQFDSGSKHSLRQIQSDLIDKFIIANPRIEPVRGKPDNPVEDISKPFTEKRDDLVTETLARIYIKQGYYSKAIGIYEKLSLKFPEKSSYFASQIEIVKELIK